MKIYDVFFFKNILGGPVEQWVSYVRQAHQRRSSETKLHNLVYIRLCNSQRSG